MSSKRVAISIAVFITVSLIAALTFWAAPALADNPTWILTYTGGNFVLVPASTQWIVSMTLTNLKVSSGGVTIDSLKLNPLQTALTYYSHSNGKFSAGYDPTSEAVLYDEFYGGALSYVDATTSFGNLGWHLNYVNAGPSVGFSGTDGIGKLGILNGAGGTSAANFRLHNFSLPVGNTGNVTVSSYYENWATAAANVTLWWGLSDVSIAVTTEAVDAIGFKAAGTGNWYAQTRASSTETTTDTGIPQSTATLHRFEFRINAAGNSITFYVDGVLKATHTTNIPTAILAPTYQMVGTSGASGGFNIDYFLIRYSGLSR